MRDRYSDLVNSGPGKNLAAMLGLPRPVKLRRYAVGEPLLVGPAIVRGVGGGPLLPQIRRILASTGVDIVSGELAETDAGSLYSGSGAIPVAGQVSGSDTTSVAGSGPGAGPDLGSGSGSGPGSGLRAGSGRGSGSSSGSGSGTGTGTGSGTGSGSRTGTSYDCRLGAVVVDVSAARAVDDLESLRALLAPSLRRLDSCARIVLVGTLPESLADPAAAATQRALEGIVRSVAKELRAGATANLIYVGQGSGPALESPLRFLLSARSAYVDGQVIRVASAAVTPPADWARPFAGQVVVVTGAARGIGASIVEVLARDGAHVICLDLPSAGDALAAVANRVGGTALHLDITAADAGERIAAHLAARHGGKLDVLVHNAGITRDKLLVNTDADRWASVLNVNLAAQLRMNKVLLAPDCQGGVSDGGRIVTVSSTSGIAGNRGQTSYAASKAGLIGMVQALAAQVADRGITVNAVAPGFIETEMTARIPLATREVGRRINSLGQGGQPVDVGETIAWLAQAASAGVSGQVIRVCGQSLLGA